jgi:hypothetical protein
MLGRRALPAGRRAPRSGPCSAWTRHSWSLKGGLPYQPWAAAARKARMEDNGKDDPSSHCLPRGAIRSHTTPLFRKIVQVPGLVLILSEANASYRQIFTDGRPLPTIELTVDDPKAYTAPWTVKLNHSILLDTELLDYICLENEKSVKHMVGR